MPHIAIKDPNWFWMVMDRWTHDVEITAITREGDKLSIIVPVQRLKEALMEPKYRPTREARQLYLDDKIDLAQFEEMIAKELHRYEMHRV